MLRNLSSTNAGSDVDTDYGKQVMDLLNDRDPNAVSVLRRSHSYDETRTPNSNALVIELVRFTCPRNGRTRWAIDYSDPASREVEDTDDLPEATARYEEMVREAASVWDQDGAYDLTDVDGVPTR
jgi:hypothetical protein